jgi:hypothetical protein
MSFFGSLRALVVNDASSSEEEEEYEQEEFDGIGCFSAPQGSVVSCRDSFAEPSVCESGHVFAAPAMAVNRAGPYQARADDPIDVKVAEFFRETPQAFVKNSGLIRLRPGMYMLNGRTFEIELENRAAGYSGYLIPTLMVKDGPLRQLFADYIENKDDDTAQYSGSVFQTKNAISNIPQNCRMTFNDKGSDYSRKEAMMVAKEQALVREKAATMLKEGQVPTTDLQSKYARSITMKLGRNRGFEDAVSFATVCPGSLSQYSSLPSQYYAGPPQANSMLVRS